MSPLPDAALNGELVPGTHLRQEALDEPISALAEGVARGCYPTVAESKSAEAPNRENWAAWL